MKLHNCYTNGARGAGRRKTVLFELVLPDLRRMPREPRMLYVLTGSGYDAAKGEVTDPT